MGKLICMESLPLPYDGKKENGKKTKQLQDSQDEDK